MKRGISLICSLAMVIQLLLGAVPVLAEENGGEKYTAPESPAVTYNMNVDWKFKKAEVHSSLTDAINSVKDGSDKAFYENDFDDTSWETISVPHPVNALESFDNKCYDSGEAGLFRGFMFYRKHVTIPASDAGKKMFLEFEAIRNSVYLYVNGEMVGYYEAGIAATGFDITKYVKPGEENVIAVATDNGDARGQADKTNITTETKPGTEPGSRSGDGYQWNTKDFNEVQGGITGNVDLYAKGTVYQTLPLYNNLKTTGNYIYGSNFDIDGKSATINVKAEVRNETEADKDLTLQVDIVGMDGKLAHSFEQTGTAAAAADADAHFMNMVPEDAYNDNPAPTDISTVDVSYINASDKMENMRFWSDKDPYLYTVYTILKDGEDIIDVQKTVTGFRKVEYDINNGLRINDQYTYLKGYAQRATNEWAVAGVANDWLSDIDMQLVAESNANHIRWMHVAPKPVAVRSTDKYGIFVTCPAGDKEGDVEGRAWDQRVEAMRDAMIYFRNNPSVLFWEAGNNAVTAEHMKEMTALKTALDPDGGRFAGCRTISSVEQIKEAEYVGTMENRNASDAKTSMTSADGKYMPITETEYARDEAPRRVWDDFSPPDYDYRNKWLGKDGKKDDNYDIWDQTSEDFAVGNARQYNQFWAGRVTGGGSELYTGAAIMVWSDSNMHTRNCWSENCRTSGKVDAVRQKKEAFYALQAVQSDKPKIHIVGHWNYPEYNDDNYWYEDKTWDGTSWNLNGNMLQRDPSKKTVYVIGSPDIARVELFINDKKVGENYKPEANFIYKFPDIDVTQSGEIKAVAYDENDVEVTEDIIETAGEPDHIELEPVTGPGGLVADGSDVMYFDVKVVDADGNVCPLNYDRLDLEVSGDGILLGGYNSGEGDSVKNYGWSDLNEINSGFVFAECGINRVFVKSTRDAGDITLKVMHEGLGSFESTITSTAFDNSVDGGEGLSTQMQRDYPNGEKPPVVAKKVEAFKPLAAAVKADFGENGNTRIVEEKDEKDYYTVKVNGKDVNFTDKPYMPIGASVVAEIAPILDALKAEGASIAYTESATKPAYISKNGAEPVVTITGGIKADAQNEAKEKITKIDLANTYTTFVFNEQDNNEGLMNAAFAVSAGGKLTGELVQVLSYLEGVTAERDDENKIYNITYSAVTTASADEEISLFSLEDDVTLMAIDPKYEKQSYLDDFNTDTRTDGPDGTGYTSPTATTNIISEKKAEVGALLKSDCILSFDFRIDENKSDFNFIEIKSGGSLGPSFRLKDGKLQNETKGSTFESLGEVTVGNWYHFEMEGTVGTGVSPIPARLYSYNNGELALVQAGTIVLRNIWNKVPDAINVNSGISIDNLKIVSIYGDEVAVSSLKDEINANESLAMAAKATRGGNDVIVAPSFTWSLLDENGNELTDENISIDENGTLTTTALAPNMTVTVRATASSLGNPYGDKKITIHGLDTSKDTFDEITASCETEYVRTGEPAEITTVRKMKGETLADEISSDNYVLITPAEDVTDAQLIFASYNPDTNALEQLKLGEEKFSASADETVLVDVPFEVGTDTKVMLWKSLESIEPVDAVIDAETDASGIVWKIYNADKTREFKNSGIKVKDGIVTVDKDVVPQTINVRASNTSGSSQAWVKLQIKPGNMILDGEMGNKDTFVSGNACEDIITNASIKDGSWDGSGYYDVTSGSLPFTGFEANTSEHVIYAADMKFNENFAGWTIWNASNGKQGLQIILRDKDSKLGIVKGGNNSSDPYCNLEKNAWYHIEIMCSTGVSPNSYANLIVYKYDANGNKVHPETGALNVPYVAEKINMRNLSVDSANHIEINAGTSVDNVWCARVTPDELEVSADKTSMFAGQKIQGKVVAKRKGVPFGYISSDLVKWSVYDENNENPLVSDLVTVNSASGELTADALAPSQTVYLRASTLDRSLYDDIKITIQSSDVFTVKTIGFDENYTAVKALDVKKNFAYSDDVTFVVCVYDESESKMKSVSARKMSAKNIARSEEAVEISMDAQLPEDFDKTKDVLYVYTLTSVSENEAVTEADGTIEASVTPMSSDKADLISFTKLPEFDASSPVYVMILNENAVTTSVEDSDIMYLKQFTGATLKELSNVKISGINGNSYIIKMAGKVNGMSAIRTGTVQ